MAVPGSFGNVELLLPQCDGAVCDIAINDKEGLMMVTLGGDMPDGTGGRAFARFVYLRIGLALLRYKPEGVIVDMRGLKYSWGLGMAEAFLAFDHVDVWDGEGFVTGYVISGNNDKGLSGLWGLNLKEKDSPKEGVFYDLQRAIDYVKKRCEELL